MAILEEPIKGIPTIKNYIDGEWVESKGEIIDVVNPVKCETIAKVGISTKGVGVKSPFSSFYFQARAKRRLDHFTMHTLNIDLMN